MSWLGEQHLYYRGGQGNYDYYGNLDVESVSRSGGDVTISGYIRLTAKGTSGYGSNYYNGVTATPTNGNEVTLLGNSETIYNGNSKDVWFSSTYHNVPLTSTSVNLSVTYNAWYNSSHTSTYWSVTKSWGVGIPQGGSAPSGGYVTFDECRWDYIKATSGVSSWGGLNGNNHFAVMTGTSNGDASNITSFGGTRREYYHDDNQDASHQFVCTTSSTSATYDGTPLEIKGLLAYKIGAWYGNDVGSMTAFDNTLRHLPPAPGQLSYSTTTTGSAIDVTINYTGVAANNHTGYDAAELKRTVRWRSPSSQTWSYIDNDVVAALTDVTSDTVTILAQDSIIVEAWMTYYGWQSEVSTVTIVNSNDPVNIYASVEGDSKAIDKIYGSVDDLSVPVVKVYGSVEGVARKVFEDVSIQSPEIPLEDVSVPTPGEG